MRADFLEGNFDLPAAHEPGENVAIRTNERVPRNSQLCASARSTFEYRAKTCIKIATTVTSGALWCAANRGRSRRSPLAAAAITSNRPICLRPARHFAVKMGLATVHATSDKCYCLHQSSSSRSQPVGPSSSSKLTHLWVGTDEVFDDLHKKIHTEFFVAKRGSVPIDVNRAFGGRQSKRQRAHFLATMRLRLDEAEWPTRPHRHSARASGAPASLWPACVTVPHIPPLADQTKWTRFAKSLKERVFPNPQYSRSMISAGTLEKPSASDAW
jgi:hypothetical protein